MNRELYRTILFTLFSISAGVIQVLVFALLGLTALPYWPKYLIALTASVVWNFTLNRNITFRSVANVPVAMIQVFFFYLVFTPVSTLAGNYLVEELHWIELIVLGLTMITNFVLEYLYDRFLVFRDSIDTK